MHKVFGFAFLSHQVRLTHDLVLQKDCQPHGYFCHLHSGIKSGCTLRRENESGFGGLGTYSFKLGLRGMQG